MENKLRLKGQYFGALKKGTGEEIVVACWLHIDPDKTEGHVLFKSIEDSDDKLAVASVSISQAQQNSLVLSLRCSPIHEKHYRIHENACLPAAFNASATIVEGAVENRSSGTWQFSEDGGTLDLVKSTVGEESPAQQIFSDWDNFKSWADLYTRQPGGAFRGQGARHRLCTTFHRTGRVDMVRYVFQDLPQFVDYLETTTGQIFNTSEPKDFGAVLGLAQHYGFPTPMLDWTMSPYVAAYFAFADVVEKVDPPSHIRIFRLSPEYVNEGLNQSVMNTIAAEQVVVAYRPPSRGNGRLLSQQGLFTFSNVVDIEARLREIEAGRRLNSGALLEIVDVSSNQARRALADLRNMGTTAATLFPGLDGVAQHLRHLNFYSP